MERRQADLQAALARDDEVEVGTLEAAEDVGISSQALATLGSARPRDLPTARRLAHTVEAVVETGLTGVVYRLRGADGRAYAVKVAHEQAKVHNVEGRASFLVELWRRRDLLALPHLRVAPTLYASRRRNVIVSRWIDGTLLGTELPDSGGLNAAKCESLLRLGLELELAGLFDWDFDTTNVLYSGDTAWLFDLGYMYPFDPLTEFNPNGRADPVFSMFERFRDNYLFHYLERLERTGQIEASRSVYRDYLRLIPAFWREKACHLASLGASAEIIAHAEHEAETHEALWRGGDDAVERQFERRYVIDRYSSLKTTIEDHRFGRCFDALYFERCAEMTTLLENAWALLREVEVLLWGEGDLSLEALLERYRHTYPNDGRAEDEAKLLRRRAVELGA